MSDVKIYFDVWKRGDLSTLLRPTFSYLPKVNASNLGLVVTKRMPGAYSTQAFIYHTPHTHIYTSLRLICRVLSVSSSLGGSEHVQPLCYCLLLA